MQFIAAHMVKSRSRRKRQAKRQRRYMNDDHDHDDECDVDRIRGNDEFRMCKYENAIKCYTQAIEKCVNEKGAEDVRLYSNRSAAYIALGLYEDALMDAEKCIAMDDTFIKGYMRCGDSLLRLMRYKEAYDVLTKGMNVAVTEEEKQWLGDSLCELNGIVDRLHLQLDTSSASSSSEVCVNPDSQRFERMCQWLKEGGARFPRLHMKYYEHESRGVHAYGDIENDTEILYIPNSHIMTSDVAKASDIGKEIISSGVDLRSKHTYLACYLCEQYDDKHSFWRPYLDMLPMDYSNMPIHFGDDLLRLLQGSFSLDKIADRKTSLKAEYTNICRYVPRFKDMATYERFVWARLVVITRLFGIVVNGKKTDGLVPYADLLNHKLPRDTKWVYDDGLSGFTVKSLKRIQAGEEIFDSYGKKCNHRYFVNYGFSVENNPSNEAVLQFSDRSNYYGGSRTFQIPASYDTKTKECFSYVRYINMSKADSAGPGKFLRSDMKTIDGISVQNEIATLKHVRQVALDTLKRFPCSWQEDEEFLWNNPPGTIDSNVRNCYVMRHGEKKVLQWFVDLADAWIPILQKSWSNAKGQLSSIYKDDAQCHAYVNQVVIPLMKNKRANENVNTTNNAEK